MKFIVLNTYNIYSISNYIFYDLKKGKAIKFEYLFFCSERIKNTKIRWIYDRIRNKSWIPRNIRVKNKIDDIINSSTEDTVVLFTNEVLLQLSAENIKLMQQKQIKVVLLLIDPISANYNTATAAKDMLEKVKFDLVLTFDPDDAKKYGFEYYNTLYSKVTDNIPTTTKYDLCYIGNIKERFDKIKQLLNNSKKNNAHFFLKLAGCNKKEKKNLPSEAVLKKILKYEEILKLTQESNCIFDMTQDGQKGVTFRYYEAIVYNKKLLTNNRAITEMPYYDERYIKFYDNIDDIDWEWVKKQEKIDYGYKGEFSPINLLNNIESLLQLDKE